MKYMVDTKELKTLMIKNDFSTFDELAEAADLSRDTVAAVINGKRRPSTSVMEKLMIAFKLEPQKAGVVFFVPDLRNT